MSNCSTVSFVMTKTNYTKVIIIITVSDFYYSPPLVLTPHHFSTAMFLHQRGCSHMVGLYSSLHPLTFTAPSGILLHWISALLPPLQPYTHYSLLRLYYYCHLRGPVWLCGASDPLRVAHPSGSQRCYTLYYSSWCMNLSRLLLLLVCQSGRRWWAC